MHGAHLLLQDLALVLCVAAVTTVLFRKLRQPVVLGYLLAGMIVGPHIPIPIFADLDRVHTLSELGVILVMFSVGLEFSIRKLVRVLPRAGVAGLIQLSVMIWVGFMVGRAFGWTVRESLFGGAAISISSTMIVAKTFAEQKLEGKTVDLVFGILVVQDLAAVLLLALLTALSAGGGLSGVALAASAGRLAGFLVALVALGFLVVPRAIRLVARLQSPETLLVASIGLCFALALVAQRLGYSVALGAFIAGSLVAESGESERVEHLIASVRDVFAAVFFVSVGMIVEPAMLLAHWSAIVVLTVVVLIGQAASVALGSFLGGNGVRTSIQAGLSLAQIGEFSFIIASTGLALGAVRGFLYPVAVAVAVLTTFTTPWLIRASGGVATWVDHRLPRPLQTFATLYGTWIERLRAREEHTTLRPGRLVWLMAVDTALVVAIAIGASVSMGALTGLLARHAGLGRGTGRLVVIGAAALLASPLLLGLVRCARALAALLAGLAMPPPADGEDRLAAPRRALALTIQLALLALGGAPLVAATQPFLPAPWGVGVLAILLVAFGRSFWRSAGDLDLQVTTGAQAIVAALARQAHDGPAVPEPGRLPALPALAALGDLSSVTLEADSPAIGKTLAQLEVRSATGASVIAIRRGEQGVVAPTGREALRAGDVLTLAGTQEAIDAARSLLK